MSSTIPSTLIRRKTLQACDACRTRRVKCDGHQNGDGVCSNCKRHRQLCQYGTPANALKWGTKAYIEDLQLRIASVERLVKLYAPDQDLGDLLDDDRGGPALPPPSNPILPSRFLLPSGERVDAHPSRGAKDAEVSIIADTAHTHRGEYHGSASVHGLVESALEFRDGAKYRPMTFKERFPNRRQEFWEVQSWMSPQPGPSSSCLEFPPADIIAPLVDTYFSHSNIYFPILHRPTFQRLLDQDLHQRNHEFGSLLLVVCAIGARFTNHPYLSDVPPGAVNCRVAHWLSQTRRVMKNPFTSTATLFEVQYFCLHAICMDGFPTPMRWATLGIGVRLAESVGANHMKTYGSKPTVEGELWKRVFWVLLNYERLVSATLGRVCSIRPEDFDLDLPIDCDDEYWAVDGGTEGFKQPPGKPSKLTMFILMINLFHLQTDVIRLLYPPNRDISFRDSEAEKQMFWALDVEMDKWAKSVPGHLRQLSFEPPTDPEFVRQSIYLHTHYHKFRMWVRRPFTLPSRKDSPLAPAATAMCTNSALACFSLLYKLKPRLSADLISYESALFAAACTFLINMLSQRPLEDTTQDRELLEKCLELFRMIEWRCHTASVLSIAIEGILYQSNVNPSGPHAEGKGKVVNTSKSVHHSTPTNAPTSEPPRHPSACVIEGDSGIEYYVGFDKAFAQATEPGGGAGGVAEEHSNYFASYQQPTYSAGLR